jgi:thiol-disulfide isomerase/thioredoxin
MEKKLALSTVILGVSLLSANALGQQASSTTLDLDLKGLDFKGSRMTGTMYMPNGITLSETKPSFIKTEPTYKGTPQYGVLHLGNGPHTDHAIAIDAPTDGSDAKIYIDVNGDGNLLSCGAGAWGDKKVGDGTTEYNGTYTFKVSYGNPRKESHTGMYALNFYWSPGRASIFYYRASDRVGKIKLGKETYTVKVIENNNDGVFNSPYKVDNKPTKPVWIVLDGTMKDLRGTFSVDGYNYEGMVADDGSRLTLKPTMRAVAEPKDVVTKEPELLPVGSEAPDFEVPAYTGGSLRLSSLRGKVVVLDFWATWCGPCKASLPHVQKVYDEVKDKNVLVLALNVFDDKPAYEEWMPANAQYKFTFAYDPAGRGQTSIASSQYKVSGIPTTYVIDEKGKIAATIVGFNGLSDHRLEAALAKLNVPIEVPKVSPAIGLSGSN